MTPSPLCARARVGSIASAAVKAAAALWLCPALLLLAVPEKPVWPLTLREGLPATLPGYAAAPTESLPEEEIRRVAAIAVPLPGGIGQAVLDLQPLRVLFEPAAEHRPARDEGVVGTGKRRRKVRFDGQRSGEFRRCQITRVATARRHRK